MQYRNQRGDDLIEQLRAVLSVLKTIESSSDRTLDLSLLRWAPPLEILALAALKQRENLTITYPRDGECEGYLERIGFPEGKIGLMTLPNRYIPILRFKTGERGALGRSGLESQIIHLFTNYIGAQPGVMNGIATSISEMFDNIEQHAGVEEALIHAMFYPRKPFMDICIVDTGVGIPGSYRNHGVTFDSDVDAIEKALQGISTKDKDRGTGLRSTIKVIGTAFKGTALLISGNAMASVTDGSEVKTQELPVSWPGTLIVMRIPKQSKAIEDIYKYFEAR